MGISYTEKCNIYPSCVGFIQFGQCSRGHDVLLVEIVPLLHLLRQQYGFVPQNNVLHGFRHDVEVEPSEVRPVKQKRCASARINFQYQ